MKPSLSKILRATLHVLNIDWDTWKQIRSTRKGEAVTVTQAVSYIAREYNYRHATIASYLQKDRTTIIHSIDTYKDRIKLYKAERDIYNRILEILQYKHSCVMTAYLARCKSGVLIQAPTLPERNGEFWLAEYARIFEDQEAFPQITWEKEPVKINITVTIAEYEEM